MRTVSSLALLAALVPAPARAACPTGWFEVTYFSGELDADVFLGPSCVDVRAPAFAISRAWRDRGPTRCVEGCAIGAVGTPSFETLTDAFSARFEGVFDFAGGDWVFEGVADDGVRVWVDDAPLVDAWGVRGSPGPFSAGVTLDPGLHHVRVEYVEHAGDAALTLGWRPGRPTSAAVVRATPVPAEVTVLRAQPVPAVVLLQPTPVAPVAVGGAPGGGPAAVATSPILGACGRALRLSVPVQEQVPAGGRCVYALRADAGQPLLVRVRSGAAVRAWVAWPDGTTQIAVAEGDGLYVRGLEAPEDAPLDVHVELVGDQGDRVEVVAMRAL